MYECVIRPALIGDFDSIFPLLRQLWPDRELDEKALRTIFARCLNLDNEKYFVADKDGIVVGFCSFTIKNSLWQGGYIGYISELVVDSAFRRYGIGTALLNEVIACAAGKGCKRIELDSTFHREEAHAFYEKSGFKKSAIHFSRKLATVYQ